MERCTSTLVWGEFARAHNLEFGCLVNFLYEGDNKLSVKVFDDESCHMHYHDDDSSNGNDDGEGQ
jgi:hypothetical protein